MFVSITPTATFYARIFLDRLYVNRTAHLHIHTHYANAEFKNKILVLELLICRYTNEKKYQRKNRSSKKVTGLIGRTYILCCYFYKNKKCIGINN